MIKDIHSYLDNKKLIFESSIKFQISFNKNFFEENFSSNNILDKCSIFWNKSFEMGWHALLFKKNVKAAQQHFYICGRMDEYMVGILGHRTDLRHLRSTLFNVSNVIHRFTVLLSSNPLLIQRNWQMTYPEMEDFPSKFTYPHYLQYYLIKAFLKSDIQEFTEVLEYFKSVKKTEKYTADYCYFKALAAGDIPAMEKAIEEIASSKMTAFRQKFDYKDLNKNPTWYAGLLSWDGILYTKFAKMQGYDLQIKSPLVAIAQPLIDAPPLEFYDDEFDFLKVQMPNGIMRTREEIEAAGIKIIE